MVGGVTGGRRLVRFREDDFEMRCDSCEEWWPLDGDHWKPENGMVRCRACWLEYKRIRQRVYSAVEANREMKKIAARLRYQAARESRLASNRAWRAANRERIRAYNKAYYARNREKLMADAKAYYVECREAVLLTKRQVYRERRAA